MIIYRLYFHPLAKYPGPLLHRISGLPTLYHAGKGDLHYHLYTLHHKYGMPPKSNFDNRIAYFAITNSCCVGKHLRYSPNKLSINSVKALGGK
jgi:hypothetical protein